MTRRAFLLRGAASVVAAAGAGAVYARYVERLHVGIAPVTLAIGLDRALRVVVIGDIHFDPFFDVAYLERVVALVNGLGPDVVLHTGDFVSYTTDRLADLRRVLARISPRLAHAAILGNHDHWVDADRVTSALAGAGIDVLRNRSAAIPGRSGWLVTGLESFWGGRPDPGRAIGPSRDARHIVLAHEPDAFDRLDDPRFVLQLSGHTHGGQVRLPGYGAISLPSWGRRYQMGHYALGPRRLYVHRGLGTVDDHVRFNCPPEIASLTLT
jgi:uncharacterized protein